MDKPELEHNCTHKDGEQGSAACAVAVPILPMDKPELEHNCTHKDGEQGSAACAVAVPILPMDKPELEHNCTHKDGEQGSAACAVAVPILPVNIDLFVQEQEMSSLLSSDEILLSFKQGVDRMKELIKNWSMNCDKTETGRWHFMAQIGDLVIKLKEINRLDKHKLKKSRDMVKELKEKVDQAFLERANVLCEAEYLRKEVDKYSDARSLYENIELVPVEQFYAEAPKRISKEEITKNDSHALMMARLEWELKQRKRLAAQVRIKELEKENQKKKVKELKERLQSIQSAVHKISKVSENLSTKLGIQFVPTKLKHENEKFLPAPLLTLYIEMCAYQDARGENMRVYIDGDKVCVTKMCDKVFHQEITDFVAESMEIEANDISACSGLTICETNGIPDDEILIKHPFSVYLDIVEADAKVTLQFAYLIHLGIVTVIVKSVSVQSSSSSIMMSNFLKSDTFLYELFPGDDGRQSPDPKTKYCLGERKFEKNPFSHEIAGLPYMWAQKISGLNFNPVDDMKNESSVMSDSEKCSVMHQTISAIKLRLRTRVSLSTQIHSLEQGAAVIPEELFWMFPQNLKSRLTELNPVSWKDVKTHPNQQGILDMKIVSPDDVTFTAIIERDSARLTAFVAVAPNYPVKSPVFLLSLHWKAKEDTAASNFALRELEEKINVHFVKTVPLEHMQCLLLCQIYHLLSCFDVFLESEDTGEISEFERKIAPADV